MSRAQKPSKTDGTDTRGQAYIAEALFAVILLSGIMFLSTTSLLIQDPKLSSEDRETQAEIKGDVQTVLEESKHDGSLKASVLNWDDDAAEYVGSDNDEGVYYDLPPDLFGDRLIRLEERHNASINVRLTPARNATATEGSTFNRTRPESMPYISPGNAGNKMVTVDTHITLYGGDRLQSPPEVHRTAQTSSTTSAGEERLADADSYIVPSATDSVDDDEIYNVVTVRVIVWS